MAGGRVQLREHVLAGFRRGIEQRHREGEYRPCAAILALAGRRWRGLEVDRDCKRGEAGNGGT